MHNTPAVRLSMEKGRLHARSANHEQAVPAQIMYARPLTAREEIVVLDADSKEIATLPNLEALDAESRQAAQTALAQRYHMPRITKVIQARFQHGTRYFEVETDRGTVLFALREPGKNVNWISDRHLIVRDTMGCPFEIQDLWTLDARSRRFINAML